MFRKMPLCSYRSIRLPPNFDAGEGVSLERLRENIREWAAPPKNSKK
jgi:hypothetical protein